MATDPQSLLAEAKCFMCLGVSEDEAMELALLVQWLNAETSVGNFRITDAGDFRVTSSGDSRIWT